MLSGNSAPSISEDKMNELISVVIPAYSAGPYLENCLNSVLGQTCPDIEILITDDGSTDETGKIADRFQQEYPDKIRVFHTENRGVTSARFEGIRDAKGAWIGFVDGDDEIEPDMYERLYNNAVKYDADISHCGHQTIVNGGERIHKFYGTGRLAVQSREEGLKDLLEGTFEPSLCTKLIRTSLLLDMADSDQMDLSIKYNEDLLMNFYLFQTAKNSVYEDFCGYHYLARSSSASRKAFSLERVTDPVKVRELILKCSGPDLKDIAWHKYLTSCIETYASLSVRKEYKEDAAGYRKRLLENRDQWRLLTKSEGIKLILLLFSPKLYQFSYRLYAKRFQEKKYE